MLRLALVGVFAIHHFWLEGRVFLKEDTVSPMFGLHDLKRENLRFHLSIIAYSLFIVKLRFGECPGTGVNSG